MVTSKPTFLETLFRQNAAEVQCFVQRRVGAQEAEDVMQDAYVRLLRHPNPSAIEDPRAYLYRVMANLCANRFHREEARQRTFEAEGVDPDTRVSPLPQPDEITEGVVQLEQFVSALDELPEA